jgi:serine protease Do
LPTRLSILENRHLNSLHWKIFGRLSISIALIFSVCACDKIGEKRKETSSSNSDSPIVANGLALNREPIIPPGTQLPDFTVLVDKAAPAVVNISITQKVTTHRMTDDDQPPLGDFFRHFGPPHGFPRGEEGPSDGEIKSLGSGFIVTQDGYIMTNAHVVANAEEVVVRLADKREFKAKVIGSDRRTDVALIKIKAEKLPTVSVGDPSTLKVGEWVMAIGSPFGFDSTVTKGIVSAMGRSLPDENYTPFIQTDAAVNPGNSGGPLFNLRGEVVGINSQIYSQTGGFMGISFAIPIDLATNVSNQLKVNGKVTRGRLGVRLQEVTKELAESFGLDRPKGALVAQVERGSPAEQAGMQSGDVVLKYAGRVVDSSRDLPGMVGATQPGKTITLEVWRKRHSQEVDVKVGQLQ